jgi:acyl-CoA thioester hydrolase
MRPPERRPASAPAAAFSLPVRAYYQDTDAGGVVYHGSYVSWLERARTEWLRWLGFDIRALAERDAVLFVVREMRVAYARPARLDDLVDVTVAVEHLGSAQFTVFQQVRRAQEMLVEASVNLACVAAGTLRPLRVPDALRERLAALPGAPALQPKENA